MLHNDKLALFEKPKVEQTEMSSKCLHCIINLIQSHMEIHVPKKLIKENNINLVTVGFAFMGNVIKADDFLVQGSLDKYYSTCNLLFQSQNFPFWCEVHQQRRNFMMIVYIRPNPMKVLRTRKSKFCHYSSCL